MVVVLPDSVKAVADAMHEQVALIRKGAAIQGMELDEFTDLDVLAILRWCECYTPPDKDASKTMVGMLATMRR